MAMLSGIDIVSIVGQQGAGKTTLAKSLAKRWDIPHIEASAVVREVCGDVPRDDMPKTNERTKTEPDWLGAAISRKILETTDASTIVVSGVREIEVHEVFRKYGAALTIVELLCDTDLRYSRQLATGKCDNFEQFLFHDSNEWGIGMSLVVEEAHFTISQVPVDKLISLLENTKA